MISESAKFAKRIGFRIKTLRKKKGVSRKKLSKETEVPSPQILSEIEAGNRQITTEELASIADNLDATIESLTNPFQPVKEEMGEQWKWRLKAQKEYSEEDLPQKDHVPNP